MSPQSPRKLPLNTSQLHVPSTISPVSSTDGNVSPLLPPFVPRSPMSRNQSVNHHAHSGASPSQTLNADITRPHALRLLLPTVRSTRASASPASRPASTKLSPAKHPRSRTGSAAQSLHPSPDPSNQASTCVDWVGGGRRFEVVEDQFELEGFQLYAVEKWWVFVALLITVTHYADRVVDRTRPLTALTVFTGDPAHKVSSTLWVRMSLFS